VGNIFRNFDPDWSFVPEVATAALIFRSRIRMLVNFMKFVYLDKKDRVKAWFTPSRSIALTAVAAIVLLLPLRHDSAAGQFVLEPSRRAVVRAVVPGIITAISANEGSSVAAGMPLIRLRNVPLQSNLARSEADYTVASDRATSAALRYRDFGVATRERERLAQQTGELSSEARNLELSSSISGIVLTPRAGDRLGSYVTAGTELLNIGDTSVLRARIYVPEQDVYKIRVGAPARLEVEGDFRKWNAQTAAISSLSSEIDPELVDQSQYRGITSPHFYVADLLANNPDGSLRPGMTGTARIYGKRRSLAGMAWQEVKNFVDRKVW
jgi:multidrug efflux pump subunit AcrA (membrane-fusion protein)